MCFVQEDAEEEVSEPQLCSGVRAVTCERERDLLWKQHMSGMNITGAVL